MEGGQIAATAEEPRPRARQIALWLALSAMGSVTLLGVTNHLTQNISSIPLLWVIPLAVYLLTFILCFEGGDWYRRDLYLGSLMWMLCVMAWFLADKSLQFELLWQIAVFTIGLYFVCMFCHGELARRRPGPGHLTLFYLVVSLGGVLGGVLVGIVAPITLPGYLELEIALVAVAALAILTNLKRPQPVLWLLVAVLAFTVSALVWRVRNFTEDTVYIERNYYGVLRVKENQSRVDDPETRYRSLVHGAILHGEQWLSEKYRRSATTYYKTTSGIGRTLVAFEGKPIRVGVIGLGAGSIAVYGDGDDVYRFYDINPAVEYVAKNLVHVPQGLAREDRDRAGRRAPEPRARGAAGLRRARGGRVLRRLHPGAPHHGGGLHEYLRHMKPEGVIAFHVSNRFLDLKPVLLAIAEKHGLEYAYLHETGRERRHHERLGDDHAQQVLHPQAIDRGGDRARRAAPRLAPLDRLLQQSVQVFRYLRAGAAFERTIGRTPESICFSFFEIQRERRWSGRQVAAQRRRAGIKRRAQRRRARR